MKKYRIYRQLIILVFCFFTTLIHLPAQQQSSWTLNRILNADNGLPQNTITDLYFDYTTGFLWIATEGGLVNYNGISTKIFDPQNVPAFRLARMGQFSRTVDNKIVAIDKSIVGVSINGNSVEKERFTDYESYNNGNFGFQRMPPFSDTNFSARIQSLSEKIGRPLSILTCLISCIDDSTTLVIMKEGATYIVRQTAFQLPVSLPTAVYSFLNVKPGNTIGALDSAGNGYLIDVSLKKADRIEPASPGVFKGDEVIYPDNINNRHYLLKGKRLYEIHFSNMAVETMLLADLPEVPQDVSSISVHPSYNQVYIGTIYHGVHIYTRSFFYTYQFNDIKNYKGKKPFSPEKPVVNFYAGALIDSNRALLTYLEGIDPQPCLFVDLRDGSFDFTSFKSLPGNILLDGDKNAYSSVFNAFQRHSLYPLTGTVGKTYNFFSRASYYDKKLDRLWVVNENRKILGYLANDSMYEFLPVPANEPGYYLDIKRYNDTLILFNETSLWRIDEKNRNLEKIFSFEERGLRDVFIDHDGFAWLTTYGKGIYMYDLKSRRLYHPKYDSKGHLRFPHCLVEDRSGNFFVPTNNGLFRINRKELIEACMDSTKTMFYHYYNTTNGLLQNEFNGGCYPAYNKLPNGDILLPSMQGLVRIFTSSITNARNYPLFIQAITSPLQTHEYTKNMVFGAKERSLAWEVNFAQWEYPDASGLSYRLDEDGEWKHLDAGERKILMTDLKGGNHTLYIRNQFDLEGKKISQLKVDFYVTKKYHEQTWFWLLITLALIVVIYIATHLRNLELRRANLALARKVQNKTIEINKKNRNLEQTLADLNKAMDQLKQNSTFQRKLITLLGHDFATPLKSISKVAKQLITYRQKLKEETATDAITGIDNTAAQLSFLSESIVQWIKVQEGQFSPRYSRFDMHLLAEEILSLHQPLAADKKNAVVNKVPEILLCNQDSTIVKIILHNLLLNANKFTANGTLTIHAEMRDNKLWLTVADDGAGMNADLVNDLNNMHTGFSEKGTNNEEGWGLGYSIIFAMLKIVKGNLRVTSSKGKGTAVIIEMPANGPTGN